MKSALVTGNKGFVGSKLLKALLARGFEANGIDDEYFHEGDWRVNLEKTLNSFESHFIFHVGACSDTLSKDVQDMMIKNYESTKFIAQWCKENSRKLIYSSSAACYGVDHKNPSNLYGWSKYAAEDYVVNSGGVALRYFNVYGPGETNKGKMASFALQAYIKNLRKDRVFLFPGQPRRDFVFIDDVVEANLHAMSNFEDIYGEYFEVSTGVSSTFENILDFMNIPFEYTLSSEIPSGYQYFTCGNQSKWIPGWKPKYTLESGLDEYIKFLQCEMNI